LVAYGKDDSVLWAADTNVVDEIVSADILEVVFDDISVPETCGRSLASSSSISNQTPLPITSVVTIDWSQETTSRTLWYNTLFLEAISSFHVFFVSF